MNDEFVSIGKRKEELRNEAITNDFTGNDQVHDRRIVALLIILKSIFNLDMQPLQFVFLFSILISLLMETGIMLSFATITMVIAPVLQARHIDALEKETLRVCTEGKAEQDDMRHKASMNRVRKSGIQTMDKANAAYNQAVAGV
ncbi:MAG: hypothetical protein DSY80_10140 [Desulfocapsa sp.]|nr:MAG: hypothetical protein DSY80_10140 [Desulfocapsa sp.]